MLNYMSIQHVIAPSFSFPYFFCKKFSLGSVAFMNLNLAYNSVGFYQLSKLVCIPFTIAVQRVFQRIEVSNRVKLTLVPILIGVGLATVHDIHVNFVGTIFAIFAIIFTTVAQIFTQRYQAILNCDALQLLYLTSPLIMIGMIILAPFFDDIGKLRALSLTPSLVFWIALSSLLALGVNITNYAVLGKTSPLTYQVRVYLYVCTYSYFYGGGESVCILCDS